MNSLGDRMKSYYENTYRIYLTHRTPVIIRIDGRAFHSFTKGFDKPYDFIFKKSMWRTAQYLCQKIQNAKLAYVQSDEISILMTDYDKLTTSAWFDNNLQKVCSISASMATMAFNMLFMEECRTPRIEEYNDVYSGKIGSAMFDARVFNIPESEVCNYFIWRQQDATRNSIETLGRCYFSAKQLHKVNCNQIQDMLMEKANVNWNDCPTFYKRGVCIKRVPTEVNPECRLWEIDTEIPIFTQDRAYIESTFIKEE